MPTSRGWRRQEKKIVGCVVLDLGDQPHRKLYHKDGGTSSRPSTLWRETLPVLE
jgi:hypothetical protein